MKYRQSKSIVSFVVKTSNKASRFSTWSETCSRNFLSAQGLKVRESLLRVDEVWFGLLLKATLPLAKSPWKTGIQSAWLSALYFFLPSQYIACSKKEQNVKICFGKTYLHNNFHYNVIHLFSMDRPYGSPDFSRETGQTQFHEFFFSGIWANF